jgi:AraC-like DNA-binding protein
VPRVKIAGRFADRTEVPNHVHQGLELVLVGTGRCSVLVDGQLVSGGVGDLFVLPPHIPHNQSNEGLVETRYLEVLLPARVLAPQTRVLHVGTDTPLWRWMDELVDLFWRNDPAMPGLALAVVATVVAIERQTRTEAALHPGLATALRRLEADFLEPLTVADVAKAAGISPSHCTALFRARFGCGVMAYRQRRRLELAMRLLADPYLPVAAVGAACGYPDANAFTRLFRAQHGLSPRRWRQKGRIPS